MCNVISMCLSWYNRKTYTIAACSIAHFKYRLLLDFMRHTFFAFLEITSSKCRKARGDIFPWATLIKSLTSVFANSLIKKLSSLNMKTLSYSVRFNNHCHFHISWASFVEQNIITKIRTILTEVFPQVAG